MIVKSGDNWKLKFSDGREESFSSEEAAKKREKQVIFFKHQNDEKENHFKYLSKHGGPNKSK